MWKGEFAPSDLLTLLITGGLTIQPAPTTSISHTAAAWRNGSRGGGNADSGRHSAFVETLQPRNGLSLANTARIKIL